MRFDPYDHGYTLTSPRFARFSGDTRHNVGNITARGRRPLTRAEIVRLMSERPTRR